MIEAARDLFVARGYAATTMEQIASSAGVAVQTVYYTFRTKGRLLTEVLEVTGAGEDASEPASQRPWVHEMLSATTAQRVIAVGVEHGTTIYDRVAPLWPAVLAAAAADPSVDDYWRGVGVTRRGGQHAMVARVAELGGLRPGLELREATDLVVVLAGHDVYRGLVQEARWTVPAYRGWLFTTLVAQLLGSGEVDPRALSGLSFADPTPARPVSPL